MLQNQLAFIFFVSVFTKLVEKNGSFFNQDCIYKTIVTTDRKTLIGKIHIQHGTVYYLETVGTSLFICSFDKPIQSILVHSNINELRFTYIAFTMNTYSNIIIEIQDDKTVLLYNILLVI